ncbi:GPW/gp25 family protein [Chloroflexales bacterium ZM16-3]|nr:GPW/gp25 family protein [Chloroflexales bacterium ZM16-3]
MTDILGRGWAFPVHLDASGQVALSAGVQDVEEAIIMILSTPKGQRPLRPEFGCEIHDLLFAPSDANTIGLAMYYVEQALGMWEPRIRLLDVQVRLDPKAMERLLIMIEYELKATLDRRSLVYPFYRIPEE